MSEEIIDLGEWNCPKSWDEVTLGMFQGIEKYYSENDKRFDMRDVLDIFTDHSRDEIDQLPIWVTEKLMNELSFLNEEPQWGEPSNTIEIDGVNYTINVQSKLRTGEFIAVDTVLKADKYNYAAVLAILCRKDGEVYDSRFENEIVEERVKMFSKLPVLKVMPTVSFFLGLYALSTIPTLLSSEIREGISQERENIMNSRKNGELSARSMRCAMRKLRRLEKSIKSI